MKVHNGGMAATDPRLLDWRQRFQKAPLAREVVGSLEGRSQEIWQKTFDLLRKDSPEYRNSVDEAFTAESKAHCGELLKTITAIAAGRLKSPDPFAFVRRHAEWRARHQVPLVASLHAYRLAHKTYWSITREALAGHKRRKEAMHALTMLSDFWIELFEAVGAELEDAHAAEAARSVAGNTQAHAEAIDRLLEGSEPSDAAARHLLVLNGMIPKKKMTVALLRRLVSKNGKHADIEVRLRSMVRLLEQVLPSSVSGKLVGLRNHEVVLIANGDHDTSSRLARHLRRTSFEAGIGIGLDKSEIAALPDALAEARTALELASFDRPLVHFAEVDLMELLIHRADNSTLRLIPEWISSAHRSGAERDLLRTIRVFAECSLNVKETARRLEVHTNTIYFRLNQIRQRTGCDPRTFSGTSKLFAALRLLDRDW